MKFLVMDDSGTMRKIITLALKTRGYEVLEAENGVDGLAKIKETKVDFMLVDINMPEMNGLEFIREAKKIPQYGFTPILVLTTEAEAEMKQEALSLGAKAYLIKPFQKDNLLETIDKIMS